MADFYEDDIPELIEHSEQEKEHKHVPLTIICGFLGAGKSTLLKRILTERHGYRIAVIMNEFGDTADIESKAINVSSPDDPEGATSEEFLELANGCLCCSIKDSGAAAIEKLMEKKGAFDHILLETTGLADPGPIASMFWHNEEFASGFGRDIALDGVICVVDAMFGKQQMEEDHSSDGVNIGESLRQIAGSDVILLNKVDLATPEQLFSTEDLIQKINPVSPIHRTVRGQIDLKHLLGISAYTKPPPPKEPSTGGHIHTADCKHDHDETADTTGSTHYEIRGISSLQVSCPPLSRAQYDRLDEWLRSVLWENRIPEETSEPVADGAPSLQVLRCKGTFVVDGVHHVLQGVRNMYDISELDSSQTMGIPEVGKVVLIGKGLDNSVRRSLENVFN
ncbi:cobW-domain-containing protein [Coprinopsis marcescibilis]|uniref:CobW-domain-containing protein n=1 Tax=Coprinopsis marcescibilis TaxID=230819 RepID=A0A5C3KJW0_COPMA|nr:cobW-domain-containing protein [Coprinopsis marcescibilis]